MKLNWNKTGSLGVSRMVELIDLQPEPRELWNHSEYRAVLDHLLSAKVLPDFARILSELKDAQPTFELNADLTFGQALYNSESPIALLNLIKDFAKFHWHSQNSGLPKEVAMVMYYAAIAAGLPRGRDAITTLPQESIKNGFGWVLAPDWVNDEIRSIIKEGLHSIQS